MFIGLGVQVAPSTTYLQKRVGAIRADRDAEHAEVEGDGGRRVWHLQAEEALDGASGAAGPARAVDCALA